MLRRPPGSSRPDTRFPYTTLFRSEENRLILDIRGVVEDPRAVVALPLTPFRRVVRDYFRVCERYYDAIKRLSPSQIEAIDMGRRGLHNDGSTLLQESLVGRVAMDFPTARRLFTPLCGLHIRACSRWAPIPARSAARRVGNECVRTGRSRGR